MLPLYGRSIVPMAFVDIIKYILKSFINGGHRLIYFFDACALSLVYILQSNGYSLACNVK